MEEILNTSENKNAKWLKSLKRQLYEENRLAQLDLIELSYPRIISNIRNAINLDHFTSTSPSPSSSSSTPASPLDIQLNEFFTNGLHRKLLKSFARFLNDDTIDNQQISKRALNMVAKSIKLSVRYGKFLLFFLIRIIKC